MFPSATRSLTPVTVNVWGVFQLPLLNVTLAGATVPSVVSLEARPIVTSAVGCVLRRSEERRVGHASGVSRPLDGLTVIPTVSLSLLVTATSAAFRPLYSGSLLADAAVRIM